MALETVDGDSPLLMIAFTIADNFEFPTGFVISGRDREVCIDESGRICAAFSGILRVYIYRLSLYTFTPTFSNVSPKTRLFA